VNADNARGEPKARTVDTDSREETLSQNSADWRASIAIKHFHFSCSQLSA
jgi:hypothetical protein